MTRSSHQWRSSQISWACALIHYPPCELVPLNTECVRSSECVPFYRVCSDLADSDWHFQIPVDETLLAGFFYFSVFLPDCSQRSVWTIKWICEDEPWVVHCLGTLLITCPDVKYTKNSIPKTSTPKTKNLNHTKWKRQIWGADDSWVMHQVGHWEHCLSLIQMPSTGIH